MTLLASNGILWISGWIVILALLIGGATYAARERRRRHDQR